MLYINTILHAVVASIIRSHLILSPSFFHTIRLKSLFAHMRIRHVSSELYVVVHISSIYINTNTIHASI